MSRQHTKPCAECPFARTTAPGTLGGSAPETYVGQVYGPFTLPCHRTHDYKSLDARLGATVQCAGAAIHRANIGRAGLMPDEILHLDPDPALVFATQAEFVAHHAGTSVAEAEEYLKTATPERLMEWEMRIAQKLAAEGKASVRKAQKR